MTKFKLFFLAVFLLPNLTLFSQDSLQNNKVWTLEECISYAVKNNITIKRSELTLESTKVRYDQTKAAFLPSVNARAGHNFNYGRVLDAAANQYTTSNTQNGNLQLNANLNLFNGLQTQNSLRQYNYQYKAGLFDIEQTKNDISLSVSNYYLTILLNKELLQSARIQLRSSEEQVIRTEKLVNAGSLPQSELLTVKAQKATEDLNVVNAENQFELAKLNLLQALLLPADTQFEISVPNISDLPPLPTDLSSNNIYSIAMNTQPSLKSAEYSIKSARYSELVARGARFPSFSVGAGISSNYSTLEKELISVDSIGRREYGGMLPFDTQIHRHRGKYIGFSLSIPIFNNYSIRTQIQNTLINRKRSELNQIEVKNTLRQNVEQATLNAKAAEKRYYSTGNQVESLRESFRVTEQRFNVGVVNSLDYTLAKNNLNKAESDFVRAKYDYIFRIKILDFYQNKPLTLSNNQ